MSRFSASKRTLVNLKKITMVKDGQRGFTANPVTFLWLSREISRKRLLEVSPSCYD